MYFSNLDLIPCTNVDFTNMYANLFDTLLLFYIPVCCESLISVCLRSEHVGALLVSRREFAIWCVQTPKLVTEPSSLPNRSNRYNHTKECTQSTWQCRENCGGWGAEFHRTQVRGRSRTWPHATTQDGRFTLARLGWFIFPDNSRIVFSSLQEFTHAAKMVPVKSYNDFSRPLVEKRVVWMNRNHFSSEWSHFYHNKVMYERLHDRIR